ncbi:MAG: CoA-binding protein [Chloroflexi bacterium]|nr:CoA-binding protein [Chloroflexota bacterium]
MTTKATIDEFLAQKTLAIVGISRTGKKYGNAAFKTLKSKGYKLIPVNPGAETIQGEKCYHSLAELPVTVGGVLLVTHPKDTEQLVQDADKAGIKRVWMQQGAESTAAIEYCEKHGIEAVYKQCILMFAQPSGMHAFHHWVKGAFGKLPK